MSTSEFENPDNPTDDSAPKDSAANVLGMTLRDLFNQNPDAFTLLMSLIEEGTLEAHQTQGKLNSIADQLLASLRSEAGEDAN